VRIKGLAPNLDSAWLELDPETLEHPHFALVAVDEIASFRKDKGEQACFVLGYPAGMAEKPSTVQQRPLLESACMGTFNRLVASARSARSEHFRHRMASSDGSLNDSPEPHGLSGGGVWLLPRHDDYLVWSPERARLVGIETAWWRDYGELVVTRIESWLELVANQIPELCDEVTTILEQIRLKPA
jgi:hypothetical protein